MEKQNYESFRLYLQKELVRRCRNNPSYSLRAFASHLDIENSALSKILNRKRGISEKMFLHLSSKLNFSPMEQMKFTEGSEQGDYQQIAEDQFRVISEWYHYAILELVEINNFQPNAKWIAKSLGLSISEVNIAVERLLRLKMLEISEDGVWKDLSGNVSNYPSLNTNSAFQEQQIQFLNLAIEKVKAVNFSQRDNSSVTMAIDSKKLPEAKEMVKKFRRKLCSFLQSGEKDSVYQLAVAVYPLTKIETKENKNIRSKK